MRGLTMSGKIIEYTDGDIFTIDGVSYNIRETPAGQFEELFELHTTTNPTFDVMGWLVQRSILLKKMQNAIS